MKRAALAVALALPLVAAKSDPLAGRVAGPPRDCLDIARAMGPDIVDARTILYRQNGRRTWRAEVVGACPSLRPLARLIVEPTGAQLCRNDRFRVLGQNDIIPTGYCRFGRFTPYDAR